MKLGCVIMAAGAGSRFGSNKLLADFRGEPLFRRALDAVPEGLFCRVRVVTGYDPVAALAAARGFEVTENDRPELGISRTIRLGLQELDECDGVLFMTADQPLLSAGTIGRLAAQFRREPGCIAAAACHGKRGNPCLFPRSLFPELLTLEGDTGGSRVIRQHPELVRLVETEEEELADCDTLQALRELE